MTISYLKTIMAKATGPYRINKYNQYNCFPHPLPIYLCPFSDRHSPDVPQYIGEGGGVGYILLH